MKVLTYVYFDFDGLGLQILGNLGPKSDRHFTPPRVMHFYL
jgi:hypothetical protein